MCVTFVWCVASKYASGVWIIRRIISKWFRKCCSDSYSVIKHFFTCDALWWRDVKLQAPKVGVMNLTNARHAAVAEGDVKRWHTEQHVNWIQFSVPSREKNAHTEEWKSRPVALALISSEHILHQKQMQETGWRDGNRARRLMHGTHAVTLSRCCPLKSLHSSFTLAHQTRQSP